MKHAEKNPEIRQPEKELPLFSEQSFTKFEQAKSGLSGEVTNPTQCETGAVLHSAHGIPAPDKAHKSGPSTKSSTWGAQGENGDCMSLSGHGSPRDKAHARKDDPSTSKQAAASVTNLGPTRDLILLILRKCGPQADHDLIEYFLNTARNDRDWEHLRRTTEQSIRSRRKELCDMGFVEAAGGFNEDGTTWGITGKTAAKRNCIVWKLK